MVLIVRLVALGARVNAEMVGLVMVVVAEQEQAPVQPTTMQMQIQNSMANAFAVANTATECVIVFNANVRLALNLCRGLMLLAQLQTHRRTLQPLRMLLH